MDSDQRQPEQTFQMIQCGNVELYNPIQYGILLLGNTKAGKTTSAQYLTNQVLVGYKQGVDRIFYKIQESKHKAAEIGENERVSKTQIPNLFEIQMGDLSKSKIGPAKKKSYLIDCPGYIDTYGCYRIISNRFFHILVFSKVEKMKFVLTWSFNDMDKACILMLSTFKEFLKGFRKFSQVKEDIFAATSIMITSVPSHLNKQQVLQVFKGSSENVDFDLKQIFLELKAEIIKNQKINIFHKAQVDKVCPKNTILDELKKQDKKSGKFWVRPVDKQENADMSNIQTSIVDYSAVDPKLFELQLGIVSQFYKKQILEQVQSLNNILAILAEDNRVGGESSNCITQIIKKSTEKTKWRNEKSKCKDLYQSFNEKRNVLKNAIFRQEVKQKSEKSDASWTEIPFWLCKMKAFMKIEEFSQIVAIFDGERDIKTLKIWENIIREILIIFINLGKRKKEKSTKADQQKNDQILNYAYEVYKDINISNKLFSLVHDEELDLKSEAVKKLQKNAEFILVQYPAKIKQLFLKALRIPSIEMLIQNLNIIQEDENLSGNAYSAIADFIVVMRNRMDRYEMQNKKQKISAKDEEKGQKKDIDKHTAKKQNTNLDFNFNYIRQQLATKRIKFLNMCFETLRKQVKPPLSKLLQMEEIRKETGEKIKSGNTTKSKNWEDLVCLNNKVVQLMAQFVQKNGHYDLAIKLYDSICDPVKIFEIMKIKQDRVRNQGNKPLQLVQILSEYMKRAQKYHRKQLALAKGYEARHYAIDACHTEWTNQINQSLKQICKGLKDKDDQVYAFLFNQGNEANIDDKTRNQILALGQLAQKQHSPQKKNK